MAIETAVVTGTAPTTATTKSFEVSGFGTPQAAIISFSNTYSGNNPSVHARIGFGFTDGTTDIGATINSTDAAASSNTDRQLATGFCAKIINGAGSTVIVASFSAWATNGITLDFTTVDGNAHDIQITLIKGCTSVKTGLTQITTTGVNDITAPGFKPNLIYTMSVGSNSTAVGTQAILCFGAAHNNSSDVVTQGQVAVASQNGSSNENSNTITRNDSCVGQMFNDIQGWKGAAQDFDASGFSINTGADSPGNDYMGWIALDTGDTDGVSIDIVDSPTATGTWDVTAPGFTPQSVFLCMTAASAVNTIVTADPMTFAVGMFDDTNEGCIGVDYDEGAATMNIQTNASATNAVQTYEFGGSTHDLMHEGSFSSFDSSGYNMSFPTYVDGTARKWLSIAIEGAAAPSGRIMSSLANHGGLAGFGGLAGQGGGLAG